MRIAFDVDGTLVDTQNQPREMLVLMAHALADAGHHVIVWSGGGKGYAEFNAQRLGLDMVVTCMAKDPHIDVDIAIDDMPDTSFKSALTLVVQ